jgi:thiamine biosynthesis lipoprotein
MKRSFNPYLYILLLSVAGIVGLFAVKNIDSARTVSRDGVAMDTLVTLSVSAPKADRSVSDLNRVLDEAFAMIRALDETMSMNDPNSALAALNASPAGLPAIVPGDLYRVLESAVELSEITGGAFDPTIGAVTPLWRDGKGGFRVPRQADLARVLPLVGIENVALTPPNSVTLKKRGVKIDLGGIGKGYASHRVAALLQERGIVSAMINLGGNVVTLGGRADGTAWRIGIQDPSKPHGTPLCALRVHNMSVITAGVYERTWEADGVTYTHIFDPWTGVPISGDLQSVTVVADDAVAGDALSTAFMVMGPAFAADLLRILPGVDAVFVSGTGPAFDILATEGLRNSIELLNRDCALSFVGAY